MAGHIQLGRFADTTLRDYVLEDIHGWQSASANPYAARISTGGAYSDLDTFADLTLQDWHSGVGNIDPELGQLFSMAETRYPGYLMPSPRWVYPNAAKWNSAEGIYTGQDTVPYGAEVVATSFLAFASANVTSIWVYCSAPARATFTVKLHADSVSDPGLPGTVLATGTCTILTYQPFAHWNQFAISSTALTQGTRYHISIKSSMSAALSGGMFPYLPRINVTDDEMSSQSHDDGATWSAFSEEAGFDFLVAYTTGSLSGDSAAGQIKGIFTNGTQTCVWHDNAISLLTGGGFTSKVTATTIYDVHQVGDELYVSYGTGYKKYVMSTDTTTDHTTFVSYRMLAHRGYLWRSTGNGLSYSADEVTWTTLDNFTSLTSNDITGLAGLGDVVYAATAAGLYAMPGGDWILQAVGWPIVDAKNGKGMIAWENSLYIPLAGGTIMRYGADGSLINVGINAKEELPPELQGNVSYLYPTNYFLMAIVETTQAAGHSSLWSYNGDGWHCLSIGPMALGGGAICIDRTGQYLYWGLDYLCLMRTVHLSDVNNPARNLESLFLTRDSWVEYDRFYGGYRTLDKDFDRIYIDLEEPGAHVEVYWRDPTHNSVARAGYIVYDWEYLGTVATEDGFAIQFPATSRPGGKWIRLGFRVKSMDFYVNAPPVVRGIALKYSTNVGDRWRWVLPILVSENQQMPDGTINQYTPEEMNTELDALVAQTAPLRFVDIDGREYTIKVVGVSRNLPRYDYLDGTGGRVEVVYTLTAEEIA